MDSAVPQLKPVEIQTFRNLTRDIGFDVFLRLSEDNFVHVFSKTTGLDYKRLAQYIQKGVKELYIRPEDSDAYHAFTGRTAGMVFADPTTPTERKIAALLNMTEQNMAELFSQISIAEETARDSQQLVKSYVELMSHSPNSLALILKLVSHGEYLYYHSIAVAIFSMFIAKATGQYDSKSLETIGLGGFLHDIGCTQISKETLTEPGGLSPEQWGEIHAHTKLGLKMIEETRNIPDDVRYIIYQHHEQPCGKGYPNALSNDAIFYPARIVALADGFSALISKRPFRPAYTVEQALGILNTEAGTKYDRALVQILVGVLTSRRAA